MDVNPFPDLKVVSSKVLDELSARGVCPKCQKSRKYYCYNCYVPVEGLEIHVPRVKLPLKVDIIKHPSECDGKSTAAHAAVISPEDVTIYTYPCIPDYSVKENVVLVFPGDKSITLEELAGQCTRRTATSCDVGQKRKFVKEESDTSKCDSMSESVKTENVYDKKPKLDTDCNSAIPTEDGTENSNTQAVNDKVKDGCITDPVRTETETAMSCNQTGSVTADSKPVVGCLPCLERVVFIDSTWNQTRTICRDERLQGLRCVELRTRTTQFWRHQKNNPNTYLATIEAIYYFLQDYHQHFISTSYRGEYDNLLYFFVFMYRKIRGLYDGGEGLRAYQERREKSAQS